MGAPSPPILRSRRTLIFSYLMFGAGYAGDARLRRVVLAVILDASSVVLPVRYSPLLLSTTSPPPHTNPLHRPRHQTTERESCLQLLGLKGGYTSTVQAVQSVLTEHSPSKPSHEASIIPQRQHHTPSARPHNKSARVRNHAARPSARYSRRRLITHLSRSRICWPMRLLNVERLALNAWTWFGSQWSRFRSSW